MLISLTRVAMHCSGLFVIDTLKMSSYILLLVVCAVRAADPYEGKPCALEAHPSVEYWCDGAGAGAGAARCGAAVPDGALAEPRCASQYYSDSPLPLRRCFNSQWDYEPRCQPECGRVTPAGGALVGGGRGARRGELPWHVGVYSALSSPPLQICGGSIISNFVVLSAAHCFWSDVERQLPASDFLVAAGKLYRPWGDPKDQAQKSTVKIIHLPSRFQGAASHFQDDLAVVVLRSGLVWRSHVRPVCLSFDFQLERTQLSAGNQGKVAGWGLTTPSGRPSPVLQTALLPYIEVGTCLARAPPDFTQFITSDKICAGTLDSSVSVCRGDSGGGLSFSWAGRYYLRGVVSTAPRAGAEGRACDQRGLAAFTALAQHERFIKEYYIQSGVFRCGSGAYVAAGLHCDGARDCADGADERAAACARASCAAHHFRCGYGACVDRGALCNQMVDCADGSDEADCDTETPPCRAAPDADPVPGYEWDRRTRQCYRLHAETGSWSAGAARCAAEGARLAPLASPTHETVLKELFRRYPPSTLKGSYRNHVAVGVYRQNGTWWTTTGSPLDTRGVWSPWYPGYPSADEAKTVAFMERDGTIEDYHDDASHIYAGHICELTPK